MIQINYPRLVRWEVARKSQLRGIKTNMVFGLMKNTFISWSEEIVRIVYPTFVRFEFVSSAWNPYLEDDSKTF